MVVAERMFVRCKSFMKEVAIDNGLHSLGVLTVIWSVVNENVSARHALGWNSVVGAVKI